MIYAPATTTVKPKATEIKITFKEENPEKE